ncbi:RWP-RK domain-containing protein [Chloropicon primus]|uniref:RWP-RK domain-containing protein n=1 Tax=Chloropicon primus TaxID=1764295 RepID=A0A5B8MWE4_9CHLO|nr:RWP-RK domain-containing protein [Chloropicon primus]UPR04103.1 RWP-RK domain-containing protein [Chloropicon primus]|eukprot:QDZ24893.1 RWP-RK domain-containing protein [Chloropicon primus]
MRDPRCFPWNEDEQPKVVYRSLYQKGVEQNVLEVYHHSKEVWYHEYRFCSSEAQTITGVVVDEKNVITSQTKAKICMDDIDRTLESFAERALSAGFEFCYTYSCNIKKSNSFGIDYCITSPDSLPHTVKAKDCGVHRPPVSSVKMKMEKKKVKKTDMDITLVRNCFHLPMNVATQRLKIGSTALKKICRKHGIMRWPYRRIKAIEKLIQQLEETGATENFHFEAEGQVIREKLQDLYVEKEQLRLNGNTFEAAALE